MGRGRAGSFWGCPALTRRRIVLRTMAHLSRDETAPKMGHPSVVRRSDVGHPSTRLWWGRLAQIWGTDKQVTLRLIAAAVTTDPLSSKSNV